MIQLKNTIPIWDNQPHANRLSLAITALAVANILSPGEVDKARKRLNKMWEKQNEEKK